MVKTPAVHDLIPTLLIIAARGTLPYYRTRSRCGGGMSVRSAKLVSLFLLCLFSAGVMLGEVRAAMALANGVVALNGSALLHSSAIFAGDQLETSANSAVTISANGTSILVGANSRIHYFSDSVGLHSGSAQVNTSNGMKLETDSITVLPNKDAAKYRVERSTDTVTIAALTGELRVINGTDSTVLQAGTGMTLKEVDYDQTESPVKGPSNRKIFVWVGGATAATGALVWATVDHKKPISNQIP